MLYVYSFLNFFLNTALRAIKLLLARVLILCLCCIFLCVSIIQLKGQNCNDQTNITASYNIAASYIAINQFIHKLIHKLIYQSIIKQCLAHDQENSATTIPLNFQTFDQGFKIDGLKTNDKNINTNSIINADNINISELTDIQKDAQNCEKSENTSNCNLHNINLSNIQFNSNNLANNCNLNSSNAQNTQNIQHISNVNPPDAGIQQQNISQNQNIQFSTKISESANKLFYNIIDQIKYKYIGDISDASLIEGAIKGMLSSLDKHSTYLTPEEYANMLSENKGTFVGLGIGLTIDKRLVKINHVYENGPAFRAGIKVNDIITKIDNKDLDLILDIQHITSQLRGEPGSIVRLQLYRPGIGIMNLKLERQIIQMIPVKAKLINNKMIGYIKITSFNENTASNVKNNLIKLLKMNQAMIGLILDLRWNPGGLLDQSVAVSNLFMSGGDIVSIKKRDTEENIVYKADMLDITNKLPIVVIVNSSSASASEIVAAALQDNERAIILGTKTVGKGSAQEIIPLSNGGAIKLTTALHYTPNGRCIESTGIIPDIIAPEAIITATLNENIRPVTAQEILDDTGFIQQNSDQNTIMSKPGHKTENKKFDKNSNQKNYPDVSDKMNTTNLYYGKKNNDNDNEIKIITDNETFIISDESKDFQLLRAIDVLQTFHMLKPTFVMKQIAK